MGKDSDKHLVGQPILKQIVDLVPRSLFDKLVFEQDSDRYYKTFDSWKQFVTLLWGILSRCDSTTEIASGMQALQGKLNHLGLESSPAKSTIGDGLRNRDEKGHTYQFITNNFQISNQMVAVIYKKRWSIELVFKKLKQNFQLHYFYSGTENGIKTQIWCTLIAQLFLMILKAKTKTKKAFSTVAALIRIHLISHLDLYWLIQNCSRTYIKKKVKRNKSPGIQQQLDW
jgi:Transposase